MGDILQWVRFHFKYFREAGRCLIPFCLPFSWELEVDIWDIFGASSIFIFLSFLKIFHGLESNGVCVVSLIYVYSFPSPQATWGRLISCSHSRFLRTEPCALIRYNQFQTIFHSCLVLDTFFCVWFSDSFWHCWYSYLCPQKVLCKLQEGWKFFWMDVQMTP